MKLTIVLVVYKMMVEESVTYQTVVNNLFSNDLAKDIDFIIYDNSPKEQKFNPTTNHDYKVSYVHDPRNSGIATAYNFALGYAKETQSDWLLLLDHDTEITIDYVNNLFAGKSYANEVVALVPKIHCGDVMISPVYSDTLRPLVGERPKAGIQYRPIMAINSGAVLRISFLDEINGFNNEFPLDYLDHWLFHEIYSRGNLVYVMDVTLEHELSVMDYSRVSLSRYKSILDSEFHYYKNYKRELYGSFKKQLKKRLIKQLILVKKSPSPFIKVFI